jgi:hypothetical protein
MASFARSLQGYLPSMPFAPVYHNLHDQSQPLYHPSPPLPQYQQATAYDPKAPIYEAKPLQTPPCSPSISKARKAFTKYRRHLKVVVLISNIISTGLSAYMALTMAYMTVRYLQTKDKTAYNKQNVLVTPWAKNTQVWPTYLLLASAAMTLLGAVLTLVKFCVSKRSRFVFKLLYYVVHVALWVAVTVLFRVGKTGNDLWGWSCDMVGGEREQLFKDVINFEVLCKIQVCQYRLTRGLEALRKFDR